VTVCGCGHQGRVQLRALARVLEVSRVFAWDVDASRAQSLASEMSSELRIDVNATDCLAQAAAQSDVIVTCTPSHAPFVTCEMVRRGTFIAAVGADSPDKQELESAILSTATVVADVLDQCATIGELHHALDARLLTRDHVHGELGEIVAGTKPGRRSLDEITVFDSTGTALQDVAAAALVYEKAAQQGRGLVVDQDAATGPPQRFLGRRDRANHS
jgi:ornithine cyclodeaminase/alanine dehydrogenase-like protein (mu-crystallin family)